MGQLENDMILGTSAYKNGLRATTFTQRDKGIGYLAGASDDPQIVRTAYIDAPEADKITARAHALRAAAGTLTGHAIGADDDMAQRESTVSLLDDLVAVTRADEPKVWLETLAARLAELRPDTYGTWATVDGETRARQLSAALKPYGLTPLQVWGSTGSGKGANRRGLALADLLTADERRQRRSPDGQRKPGPSGPPFSRPPR
jgi:S-DNA-T family DNA segregation ATPase FtsK/SpoIIIE